MNAKNNAPKFVLLDGLYKIKVYVRAQINWKMCERTSQNEQRLHVSIQEERRYPHLVTTMTYP
jgi:hypothetical protein